MKIESNKMFMLCVYYQTFPSFFFHAVGTFLAVVWGQPLRSKRVGQNSFVAATSNEGFAVDESKEESRTD